MKIILRASFIGLFLLLIAPLSAQSTPTCGALTLPAGQILSDSSPYIAFGPVAVAAGTTLTIEATTAPTFQITAFLGIATVGEIAYADNRQANTPTLILSYHFAEATADVSGQILWATTTANNAAVVTLHCSDTISTTTTTAETTLDAARFTPAERPTATSRPRNGTAAGMSYTRYNNGIQITGTDANGQPFTLAFVLPPQATATTDTLVAGSLKHGVAIYQLSDGTYQVNVGPDKDGRVKVTVFDAILPTRARNYSFIAPR